MPIVEIQTPTVSGSLDAKIVDVAGNGLPSIVRANEEWRIDASWYLDGTFASSIAGSWRLQAQLQGSDDVVTELRRPVNPLVIALDQRTGSANPYTGQIVFPAGEFSGLLATRDSIVFDIVVTLNFRDVANAPGPMAAFVNLGQLQVYA